MTTRPATPTPTPMTDTTQGLRALSDWLEQGLLERDTAARLLLLAAVAGEHVLLLGPPGTAKSELARRLQQVVEAPAGSTRPVCFERLLTRFSTPEELFGPLSLKALEDDRYERLTEGYLPTAQVAFLDEVFKANSAILNALLTLLNERVFDNGTERRPVPLVTVVGASNESPSDEALQAFHDRFLIRVPVQPVTDAAFDALLAGPQDTARPPPLQRLGPAERRTITDAAQSVTLSQPTVAALHRLRQWLQGDHADGGHGGQGRSTMAPDGVGPANGAASPGPRVSDRRWRQLARLLRVAAAAEGRAQVEPADLWLTAYVAAGEPRDAQAVLAWWLGEVMQTPAADSPGWTRTTEAFEKQLEIETRAQAEDGADAAGKMALARSIGGAEGTGASSDMLRLYSARVEDQLRKRWGPLHIRSRVAQVQALRETVLATHQQALEALAQARAQLEGRLWLPPSLAHRALQPLHERAAGLHQLLDRLTATQAGFAALPVDEGLAEVPMPMPVVA